MKYPWAVPGRKVVCISDAVYLFAFHGEACPIKGNVYTIRAVYPTSRLHSGLGLRLVELINRPRLYEHIGFSECWFSVEFFKPATDISLFREILAKAGRDPITTGPSRPARIIA